MTRVDWRAIDMMRVFVTGGSGFLGRNLIPALLERGYQVRALARSPNAAAAVKEAGATPVMGSLEDEKVLRQAIDEADFVYHAAAHTEEWGPYGDFQLVNVEGTERVLAAARAVGVMKLVHVSTEAVLLDGAPLVDVDESRPVPDAPIGAYSLTKALAETAVLSAAKAGLEAVVVRPRLLWGNGDTTVLPKLVEAVRKRRFMWIDGGRYPSSTCHVKNACEGAILAAERGRRGEVYFLTDGPPVQLREFLTELLATQGVVPRSWGVPGWLATGMARAFEWLWTKLSLKSAPPVTRMATLLFGREVTVSDKKARIELGYAPRITREKGLAAMRRG